MATRFNKMMDRLQKHKKVAIAEHEPPDGYYIELRKGWSFDPYADARVTIAPTVREAMDAVQEAQPFSGPYTR